MIKKIFTLVLTTTIWLNNTTILLKAQPPIVQQNQIVSCELNFARSAEQFGLKYAFEHHLDTIGMIASGIHLVNGLKAYANVESKKNDLLAWYPLFARTNYAEDFGFTTGPYLYYSRRGEQPVASGNYFSIWKKNKNEHFKLLFDGGVNHTSINGDYHQTLQTSSTQIMRFEKQRKIKKSTPPKLLTTYEASKYLNNEVLVLRADSPILFGKKHYTTLPNELLYHPKQDGYDESGRLYYIIGNLYTNSPTIDNKKIKGFYAQVWLFEKKWSIVADVIQLAN